VFVKMCGMTSEEDALLAVALGADAIGFVFAPSPRQITPDNARDIVRRLPHEMVTVGVFRNERPEHVVDVVSRVGLSGAQLHGSEPMREVEWVRKRIPFVIRAFVAGDPAVGKIGADAPLDVILLDSPDPGSGRVFDWRLAEGAPSTKRLMIAGGLNPENVGEAIRKVRPWGVDVVTGVEASPGQKDVTKMRRFVNAAHDAFADLADTMARVDDDDLDAVHAPFDWETDDR
jgi:phosphoribosylanthranilate isomerase